MDVLTTRLWEIGPWLWVVGSQSTQRKSGPCKGMPYLLIDDARQIITRNKWSSLTPTIYVTLSYTYSDLPRTNTAVEFRRPGERKKRIVVSGI